MEEREGGRPFEMDRITQNKTQVTTFCLVGVMSPFLHAFCGPHLEEDVRASLCLTSGQVGTTASDVTSMTTAMA